MYRVKWVTNFTKVLFATLQASLASVFIYRYCIQKHAATKVILLQISLHRVGNYLPCISNFVKYRAVSGVCVPGQVQFLYEQSFRNLRTWSMYNVTKAKIKVTGTRFKYVSM
jgi:hypothetical protein